MEEADDQLVSTVLEMYVALIRELLRSVAPQWLQLDLTMAQMRVLFVLVHKRPSSIGTLAESLHIGLPTASHLVERLVRAGLVVRTEDAKDRRYTLAHLTSWGEELMLPDMGVCIQRPSAMLIVLSNWPSASMSPRSDTPNWLLPLIWNVARPILNEGTQAMWKRQ